MQSGLAGWKDGSWSSLALSQKRNGENTRKMVFGQQRPEVQSKNVTAPTLGKLGVHLKL